ncbi:MAG: DUF6580 family putative transport protein [Bdellovibrionales bacterium]
MSKKVNVLVIVGLIVLAVLSRWLPHPPNFSPVLGVALLAGGRLLSRSMAIAVPLVAMVISDLILGWHSTIPFVYLGMVAAVLLGRGFLKDSKAFSLKIGLTTTLAAVIFFLVSNFGVWMMQDLYSHDLSGLLACNIAAVPFFQATLISGLVYTYAMFGLWEMAHSNLVDRRANLN